MTRYLTRLVLALLAWAALAAAPAQAIEDQLARFALDRFPDTAQAVEVIAASGHPRALAIIEALADGRLLVRTADRAILLREASGATTLALSGEAISGAPGPTRAVRLNNAVRRAIDAAVGGLTLLSPDPARRYEAADAVFKARNAAMLPVLATAIERERDPRIARALREARAAVVLADASQPVADRVAATTVLAARADQDALAALQSLPRDANAEVRGAADTAIETVRRRLAIVEAAQNVFAGLSLGSVLLLAAIGLAITFGVMGVINMAHGEMVMIGAYVTFVTQSLIRAHAPQLFDASLLIALPLAFLVAGLVGVLIERGVIRHLYGRPLETLLATWGVSLVLQQAVRSAFGPTNREVGNPAFMSGAFEFLGMTLLWNRVWIIGFALAVFLTLLFVMRYTSFGLRMRAVVQNRRMAASMGIRTNRVDAMTFGLGSGLAGIAGVALSQIDNVSPNLGQAYIIDSFMVVVFGGVGSLWGTLVAALSLGIANKLLEPFAGAVLGKIVILVLLILFIQKRPRGLFALKGRAVEQ